MSKYSKDAESQMMQRKMQEQQMMQEVMKNQEKALKSHLHLINKR